MLIATNAIVLKRIPYSDSSIICRLLTRDKGKVTILAKGALRPKKSVSALLEPINHIQIQYYHKNNREIQLLKEVAFAQNYSIIRKNLDRIILAMTVVEMIDRSTIEGDSNRVLYRLCWRVLDKLNDGSKSKWGIFIFFLYQLSLRLGFMPNLTNCSKCSGKMTKGKIDIYTGEVICVNCNFNSENQFFSLSTLNTLTTLHLDQIDIISFRNKDIIDSIQFLDLFLSHHITGLKKIKSMDMVRNLLNEKK